VSRDASVAWGLHAVRILLERHSDRVRLLWLQEGRDDPASRALRERAAAAGIRTEMRSAADLDRLTDGAVHQGVVAELAPRRQPDEDDLARMVEAAGRELLLLALDGVQDPHNLGACLRTAEATGVHAVVAPRDRAVGLTPAARKVAAGAAEIVPFVQVTNLARTLRSLKTAGAWVVGTEGGADRELFDADLTGPLVLVMGAEGSGMRRLTRECCDLTVRLPMRGAVESLNVSVATGIVLYEALRQRRQT
jgi:23S rRNA (guanosine2251-2'-O)-methyltransferase